VRSDCAALVVLLLASCAPSQDEIVGFEVDSTAVTSTPIPVASTSSTVVAITPAPSSSPAPETPSTIGLPASMVDTVPSRKTGSTIVEAQPRVVTLVIPLGTAERIESGIDVGDVLPASLVLSVGDRLVIVNNDTAFHIYGPLSARGGETVQFEFFAPGDFTGFCTINSIRQVTISVVGR